MACLVCLSGFHTYVLGVYGVICLMLWFLCVCGWNLWNSLAMAIFLPRHNHHVRLCGYPVGLSTADYRQ